MIKNKLLLLVAISALTPIYGMQPRRRMPRGVLGYTKNGQPIEVKSLNRGWGDKSLQGADFKSTKLDKITFSDTWLSFAHFDEATLKSILFRNANLLNATFIGTTFENVNFTQAVIGDTNFANATFTEKVYMTKDQVDLIQQQHPQLDIKGIIISDPVQDDQASHVNSQIGSPHIMNPLDDGDGDSSQTWIPAALLVFGTVTVGAILLLNGQKKDEKQAKKQSSLKKK